jgi:hypothetical protein
VTGARKGHPLKGKFWDGLAWSRIVSWGRDYLGMRLYLEQNRDEASGALTRFAYRRNRAAWMNQAIVRDRERRRSLRSGTPVSKPGSAELR